MRTLTAGPTMATRPAGQGSTATTPTVVTDVATAPQAAPPIQYDAQGHLTGIDGVLDQIMQSVTRTVTPMIRDQIYPMVQRDKALQREIGAAAGDAIARRLRGPAWLLGIGVAVIAGTMVYNASRRRK